MKLSPRHLAIAAGALIALPGCGTDTSAPDPAASGSPSSSAPVGAEATLPERHRRNLARAFENADAGRSPTMACTSVIASAAGHELPDGASPSPESVRAFELCYVDASVRYIVALLARITPASAEDERNDTCARIASYALITRSSLGSFAGNVRLDVATLDGRIAERVDAGMTAKCPDQKAALRGN